MRFWPELSRDWPAELEEILYRYFVLRLVGRKGSPQAASGEAEVHLCNADDLHRAEDD